jgi:mRNA interferase RelE/StbE
MRYQVKITAFANETGKKFSPKIKKAAKVALNELSQNPDLGKELQVELNGFRSYRFMRYRIVYKVDTENKHVVVWAIGHRRDIYENLGDNLLNLSSESK